MLFGVTCTHGQIDRNFRKITFRSYHVLKNTGNLTLIASPADCPLHQALASNWLCLACFHTAGAVIHHVQAYHSCQWHLACPHLMISWENI